MYFHYKHEKVDCKLQEKAREKKILKFFCYVQLDFFLFKWTRSSVKKNS